MFLIVFKPVSFIVLLMFVCVWGVLYGLCGLCVYAFVVLVCCFLVLCLCLCLFGCIGYLCYVRCLLYCVFSCLCLFVVSYCSVCACLCAFIKALAVLCLYVCVLVRVCVSFWLGGINRWFCVSSCFFVSRSFSLVFYDLCVIWGRVVLFMCFKVVRC